MQTIMIVEDDPDIRDGVRILLSGRATASSKPKRSPRPQPAHTGSRSGHPRHHDARHERPAGLRGDTKDLHRPHPLSHRKIAGIR